MLCPQLCCSPEVGLLTEASLHGCQPASQSHTTTAACIAAAAAAAEAAATSAIALQHVPGEQLERQRGAAAGLAGRDHAAAERGARDCATRFDLARATHDPLGRALGLRLA